MDQGSPERYAAGCFRRAGPAALSQDSRHHKYLLGAGWVSWRKASHYFPRPLCAEGKKDKVGLWFFKAAGQTSAAMPVYAH